MQIMMKQESNILIEDYIEGIMQFGLITMFANSLAIASFFTILTNLLKMKSNLNSMMFYSRRQEAQVDNGIGKWRGMMEFLAFICIPVNFAIIYFTGDGTWNKAGTSSADKYLKIDGKYEALTALLIIIAVEHGFMLLTIWLALLIEDVPASVREQEFKRNYIKKIAEEKLIKYKEAGKFKTYEELI